MDERNLTECKKCHDPIFFVKNISDTGEERWIPVNVEPVAISKAGTFLNGEGKFVKMEPGDMAYISHFSTCEFAASFRRTKKIKKADDEKVKEIIIHDLAGMMVILSKAKGLVKLKDEWEQKAFQESYTKLTDDERLKITEHKDNLKERFSVKQLVMM